MRTAKALLLITFAALLTAAAQTQTRGPAQKLTPTPLPNKPPSVKFTSSSDRLVLSECGEIAVPSCNATGTKVGLRAQATDPDGDSLLYTYSTTGGRIDGDGPEVTLDLTGAAPGVYTVTLEVDDGNGGIATDKTKVTVERCICDPPPLTPPPCPTVTVSCPTEPVRADQPITFTASVSGGDPNVTPTYTWAVSAGTISSGQGTSSITVDTTGLPNNSSVSATVDVGGYDRSCATNASCTTGYGHRPRPIKFDEYGDISVGGEKARLGNFAVELQHNPTARAYLICYGGGRGRSLAAQRRCRRAANYLGSGFLGIDDPRIVTVGGGGRKSLTVELWLVPAGADPPHATPTVGPQEVRRPAAPRKVRRRGRR